MGARSSTGRGMLVVAALASLASLVTAPASAEEPVKEITAGMAFFLQLENLAGSLRPTSSDAAAAEEARRFPAADADVLIFDMIERDEVRDSKGGSQIAICYFSAGTRESYRSEADLPSVLWNESRTASLESARPVPGIEAEYWVDPAAARTRFLDAIGRRMDICKAGGADGVLPDWLDTYLYAGITQFSEPTTYGMALQLARDIAELAESRGLSIGLRNFHEAAADLVDVYDFTVVDDCLSFGDCGDLAPFAQQHKPVVDLEYRRDDPDDDGGVSFWGGASDEQLCRQEEAVADEVELSVLVVPLRLSDPSEALSCGSGTPAAGGG